MADSDKLSYLLVAPGRFDFYDCGQLGAKGIETAARAKELKMLMNRSAQGPGGDVVNALVYQNEYVTQVAYLKQVETISNAKNCEMPWSRISDKSIW